MSNRGCFEMDLQRVVDHQSDRGYLSIGEAFEDLFYEEFVVVVGAVIPRHTLDDETLSVLDGGEE